MSAINPTDLSSLDLASYNPDFSTKHPLEVMQWVADKAVNPVITTNFRPQTSAILHLVTQVIPDIPVLWVDTGYNTDQTLEYAQKLTALLKLNLTIREPEPSQALDHFRKNGIPQLLDGVANPEHDNFTKVVKLDPFNQGLADLAPDVWITGIRQEQTDFRRTLDVLSYSKQGLLKVAPIFYWSKQQQLEYIAQHNLPDEEHYFDPTKATDKTECGIQLL